MITQELKQQIANDYANHKNTVNALGAKYGLHRTQITRIAVEMGETPRRPNSYGRRGNGAKVCPKCNKTIAINGAKYCCFCGEDIRSKQEMLCERIRAAIPCVVHLPENMRDEVRNVMLEAIKEISSNDAKQ